ncbi:uncharacterized protein C11orf97 homolog isoform X2 [Lithobates pipiens]
MLAPQKGSKRLLRKRGSYKMMKFRFHLCPSTPQEWQTVASHFASRWDFPNCGGAIDGKHVHIVPPPNSGSYYFNYKGFHSIVMLAVVSATYEFLYVDMGQNGRMSDGGVFSRTEFYWCLQSGSLGLPPPEENQEGLPFVFVADEVFAQANHLMLPFPMRTLTPDQRILNFRLSRARRVVNTFGILASQFRLFLTPIHMAEYKVYHIVLACCVLHNLLKRHSANYAVSVVQQEADLLENDNLMGLEPAHPGLPPQSAREVRTQYMEYFVGRGAKTMSKRHFKKTFFFETPSFTAWLAFRCLLCKFIFFLVVSFSSIVQTQVLSEMRGQSLLQISLLCCGSATHTPCFW